MLVLRDARWLFKASSAEDLRRWCRVLDPEELSSQLSSLERSNALSDVHAARENAEVAVVCAEARFKKKLCNALVVNGVRVLSGKTPMNVGQLLRRCGTVVVVVTVSTLQSCAILVEEAARLQRRILAVTVRGEDAEEHPQEWAVVKEHAKVLKRRLHSLGDYTSFARVVREIAVEVGGGEGEGEEKGIGPERSWVCAPPLLPAYVEPGVHVEAQRGLDRAVFGVDKAQVVAVCGPAGCGKSMVVLQMCHQGTAAEVFMGGIFWVNFASSVASGLDKTLFILAEILADVQPSAKPFSTLGVGGQLLHEMLLQPERPPSLFVVDEFDVEEEDAMFFAETMVGIVRGTNSQVVFTCANTEVKWPPVVRTLEVPDKLDSVEEANAVLASKIGKTSFSLNKRAVLPTLALLSMRQHIKESDVDSSPAALLDSALKEAEVERPKIASDFYGLSAFLKGTCWSVEDLMMLWDLSEPRTRDRAEFMLSRGYLHEKSPGKYGLPPFLRGIIVSQADSFKYYHSTLSWNLLESLKRSTQPLSPQLQGLMKCAVEGEPETVEASRRPSAYTLSFCLDHLLLEEEDASLLDEDIFLQVRWLEQCLLTPKLCGAMWTRVELVCRMFERVLETKPLGPSTRRVYALIPRVLRTSMATLCAAPQRLYEELWTRLGGLTFESGMHEVESVQVEEELFYARSLPRYSTGFMTETEDDVEAFRTLLSALDDKRLEIDAIHLRFPLPTQVFSGCAPTLVPSARHVLYTPVLGLGDVLVVTTLDAVKILDPLAHIHVMQYPLPQPRQLQVLGICACDPIRLLLATTLGCYVLNFATGVYCLGSEKEAVTAVQSCGDRLAVYTTQSPLELQVWDLADTAGARSSASASQLSLSKAVPMPEQIVDFVVQANRNAAYVVLRDESLWRVSLLDGEMWPAEITGNGRLEGIYMVELAQVGEEVMLVSVHLGGVLKTWTVGMGGEVKPNGICSMPSTAVVERASFVCMENNRHEPVTILICTTLASTGASLHAVDLNRCHYLGDLMALTRSKATLETDTAFASIRDFAVAQPAKQIITLSSGRWCYLRDWSLEELFTDVVRGWQDAQVRLKYQSVEPTSALAVYTSNSHFRVFASGSFTGNLFVNDHESGLELFSVHAHSLAVCRVLVVEAPGSGVPLVITLSSNRMMRVWSIAAEEPLTQIPKVLPTYLCATTLPSRVAIVFTTKDTLAKLCLLPLGEEGAKAAVSKLVGCETPIRGCCIVNSKASQPDRKRRRRTLTASGHAQKPMVVVIEKSLAVHWFQANGTPIKTVSPGLRAELKTPTDMLDKAPQGEAELKHLRVVEASSMKGVVGVYEKHGMNQRRKNVRCAIYWSFISGDFQWFPEEDVEAVSTAGHIVAMLTGSHNIVIYSMLSGKPQKVHEEKLHTPVHHFLVEASPPRLLEIGRIDNQLFIALAGNGGCHSLQYSYTLPSTYAV